MEKAQEMLEGYEGGNLESGFSEFGGCRHNCAACRLNATTNYIVKSGKKRAARVRECNSNGSPYFGLNRTKNRIPSHVLSNNGLCLRACSCTVRVTIFSMVQ